MKDDHILRANQSSVTQSPSLPSLLLRILVVDDDSAVRRINTAALLHSGYAVDAAEDGDAAWEALNSDCYDLMITDNAMPKVTGVELLRKLRAARMNLPVIMATGLVPNSEFAQSPWLLPAATLIKPYTLAEMLRVVKKVLREAEDSTTSPRAIQRILAVDEDHDLRQLYVAALAKPIYEIDVAADGDAGWQALLTNHYDLLIAENDTPKLSGVELVVKLRAAHIAVPVVMAARTWPEHELVRAKSLHLAATLFKPFAVDALLNTVQTVLRTTDRLGKQSEPTPVWQRQPTASDLRQ